MSTDTSVRRRLIVTKEGVVMSPILDSHDLAFRWLLDHQGQSVHHAMNHEGWSIQALPEMDSKDDEILAERQAWINGRKGPALGDWVTFGKPDKDGTRYVQRRISHIWRDNDGWDGDIQTSAPGESSFYLGNGYMSFSGALRPSLRSTLFEPFVSSKLKAGKVWFFHHNQTKAYNGVHAYADFPRWWVNGEPN